MQSYSNYYNKCYNKYLCAVYLFISKISRKQKFITNERTGINYVVKENDKYSFDLSKLTKQSFLLIIIIMLLHYATQRHGIEHHARQENHDRTIEFLEQVSGRTRIAIKHIKNVFFPNINKTLIVTYLGI